MNEMQRRHEELSGGDGAAGPAGGGGQLEGVRQAAGRIYSSTDRAIDRGLALDHERRLSQGEQEGGQ